MSVAKADLLERLNIARAATLEELLIDRDFQDRDHNRRASLLRNGMMVVLFTSLEDFIRNRTGELLSHASNTVVHFNDLPSDLRMATTYEATRATYARAQIELRSGNDVVGVIQDAAAKIASTGSTTLQFSNFSLGYKGSNLSSSEISDILRAFQVADGWNQMTSLADRCGLGGLPLKGAFDNAVRLRHDAAHSIRANVQPNDLVSFCTSALAVAAGFDMLASRAVRLIRDGDGEILRDKLKLASRINIRFIRQVGNRYSEYVEGGRRAVKVSDDRDVARKLAWTRAVHTGQPIVEQDSSRKLIDWKVSDL